MHLRGKYVLQANRNVVWGIVSNPEKVVKCLPGLQQFEVKDANTFVVTLQAGISFFKVNFKFTFALLDQDPPTHVRFRANGGGAGVSIKMDTIMDLSESQPGSTEVSWETDAELRSPFGELSSSVIHNSTRNGFGEQFLSCIKKQLEILSESR